jgi:hypothetical protein
VVAAAPAHAVTFTNAAPVSIPAGAPATTQGPAGPYPSDLAVSGVVGPVAKVNPILHGFHHQYTQDVRVLLVGPGGQSSVLMANVGTQLVDNAAPVELAFDDGVPPLPCYQNDGVPLGGGVYAPTFYPTGDSTGHCDSNLDTAGFAAPAPPGPYAAGLAPFNGANPNGVWHLYVDDVSSSDVGAIDGGWGIQFTVTPPTITAPAVKGSPEAGRKLSAVSGTITANGVASYQWERCNVRGAACKPITRATNLTYVPVRADRGHTIVLAETASNSGGEATSNSRHTALVGPALLSTSGTKRSQKVAKHKGLVAKVKSNVAGSLTASARAGKLRFGTVKRKLRAGRRVTLKLRPARGVSLAGVRKATLTLTVKDARGGKSVKKIHVRLLP